MATQSYRMIMRIGPEPGQTFDLYKAEVTIGRDPSNDIVIADTEVSRKHARLLLQAGGYVLEDLGSTNGTYANGQRLLGPHVLRAGELVMLGESVGLVFEAIVDENATVVSAPPPTTIAPPAPIPRPQPTPTFQPLPAVSSVPPAKPRPIPQATLPPAEKKRNRTWLWVGCAALLVMACLCVVGLYFFDNLNMYCVAPFNTFFTCP